jgi:hypothetical protein
MKQIECKALARALLSFLPSHAYVKKPNAICGVPVGSVFRGIIFESSGFSAAAFYPNAFAQPLYVPSNGFTLTFGKRLLGNWQYEPGQEETVAKQIIERMHIEGAFKLLEDLSTAEKMALNLNKYHPNPQDPYLQRAVAYSLAECSRFDESLSELDNCRTSLRKMIQEQPQINWPQQLLEEVTEFRNLVASDPDSAHKQLHEWTESTRAKLGLPA